MTAANDYGAKVTIGGMEFNTGADDTTVPAQRWFAAVVGWEACPKRVVTLPNVHEDGDQAQFMMLAARPLTLQGTIQVTGASPKALLDAARDRLLLATMCHPDALATLTVNDTVPTFAQVHLAEDAPQWNVTQCDEAGGTARFRVGLVAPAGAKYSVTEVVTALGAGLATPSPAPLTTASTGGSLLPNVYSYRVSAVGSAGETLASVAREVSIAQLPTPGAPALSSGVGGSLAPGTYSYRVAARNATGTTLASASASISIGGSGSVLSVTVTWSPVAGATSYDVYGRTSGSWLKMTPTPVTDTSFVDTGAVTPSGALPVANTTATANNTVTITWDPITGATGYNVYGRTPNAWAKMTPSPISATSFTDTGSVTPSGALPVAGAASVTLTNSGNWGSPPQVTVAGAATGPITIGLGALVVQVDTALGSGETLVVDFRTKEVLVNGVDRRDFLNGVSQWWKLPPGASQVNYAGGGTPTIRHRHAYG